MGGLVVRSFMVTFGKVFPSITNFISVSTPWGGKELAESGVKYSPAVIPAWRDVQPKGKFIKSIFSKKNAAYDRAFSLFWTQGQS